MADTESLRKLDAEVAEKVMQWPLSIYGTHNGNHAWLDDPANYPHAEIVDDPEPYIGLLLWRDSQCAGEYWAPSQDIAAAMTVIEKMRERFEVAVMMAPLEVKQRAADELASGEVNVEIFRPEDYAKVAEATEKTLPLAICRAALATISEGK